MSACIECQEISKYKCPVCRKPYCSVACYKIHKQSACTAPETPKAETDKKSTITYEFPTEDTVPYEALELLEKSSELKTCLENPHVRNLLEQLDQSSHPEELIQEYMQEPIFTEFVDACLKVVQPSEENK